MNHVLSNLQEHFDKYIKAAACCTETRDCSECPGEEYRDLVGAEACAQEFKRLTAQFSSAMHVIDMEGIGVHMRNNHTIYIGDIKGHDE